MQLELLRLFHIHMGKLSGEQSFSFFYESAALDWSKDETKNSFLIHPALFHDDQFACRQLESMRRGVTCATNDQLVDRTPAGLEF